MKAKVRAKAAALRGPRRPARGARRAHVHRVRSRGDGAALRLRRRARLLDALEQRPLPRRRSGGRACSINAVNDPFMPPSALPSDAVATSPWLEALFRRRGRTRGISRGSARAPFVGGASGPRLPPSPSARMTAMLRDALRPARVTTTSRAAVDAYDRGVRGLLGFGADTIDCFREALAHDPDFALARAALARVAVPRRAGRREARAAMDGRHRAAPATAPSRATARRGARGVDGRTQRRRRSADHGEPGGRTRATWC